ncbi:MAG: SH3 domain-containing protein [Clostridia bacterium]|nr:SH3 domain-containing protein [Clostridia bacterium]
MKNSSFKGTLSLIVALALLVLVATIASASADAYVVTSDNGVNVRNLPGGEESEVVGLFRYGDIIEVSEIGKFWAKTQYNGNDAYVYRDYITPLSGVDMATNITASKYSAVTNARAKLLAIALRDVKVRSLNDTKVSIGKIEEGDTVFIVGEGKYWTKVVYNGKRMGYVPADSYEITGPNLPPEGTLYRVKASADYSYSSVNVRAGATKNSKKLKTLPIGDYVKVINEEGRWWEVIYSADGDVGYIAKAYLTYAENDAIFSKVTVTEVTDEN